MGKRKERRRFPKEFKAEAVRQSEREGVTARQVAGEGVDHILSAGEETIVRSKGKAVVVADDHSSVLLYRSIAQTIPTGFVRHSRLVRAVPLRAGQLPNSLWV